MTGHNLHRIQWYFSASNIENIFDEDALEITNSSKYTLTKKNSEGELTVALTINDLNEDNDTGTYWCRGFLLDGTMLSSSNSLELKSSDMYLPLVCPHSTLKYSMSMCAQSIVTTPVVSSISSPQPLPTNELPFRTTHVYLDTTSPSELNHLPILYIIVGFVGFLIFICIVLAFIVCFLCKRVGSKGKLRRIMICIDNHK